MVAALRTSDLAPATSHDGKVWLVLRGGKAASISSQRPQGGAGRGGAASCLGLRRVSTAPQRAILYRSLNHHAALATNSLLSPLPLPLPPAPAPPPVPAPISRRA